MHGFILGKLPGLQIQVIGFNIIRGYIGHTGQFGIGEGRLQCFGDGLRDLELNIKQVAGGQFAVINISPQVFIGVGIDQLHIDSHPVTRTLHGAFHHVCDA